jgi:hypothetical protein
MPEKVVLFYRDSRAREAAPGAIPLRRLIGQGWGREHVGRGVVVKRGVRELAVLLD